MDPPPHLQQHLIDMGILEPSKTKVPDVLRPIDKFKDPRDPITGEVPF